MGAEGTGTRGSTSHQSKMFFNVQRVTEVTPKESSPGSSQPSILLSSSSSSSSEIPQAARMGFQS